VPCAQLMSRESQVSSDWFFPPQIATSAQPHYRIAAVYIQCYRVVPQARTLVRFGSSPAGGPICGYCCLEEIRVRYRSSALPNVHYWSSIILT
jgi:hypothetical protein